MVTWMCEGSGWGEWRYKERGDLVVTWMCEGSGWGEW